MPKKSARAAARPTIRSAWGTIRVDPAPIERAQVTSTSLDDLRDQLARAVEYLTILAANPAFRAATGDPAAQALYRDLARLGGELAETACVLVGDGVQAKG